MHPAHTGAVPDGGIWSKACARSSEPHRVLRERGKKKQPTPPPHFPAVVSLQSLPAQPEKGSKLLWLPSGKEQGWDMAQLVPTASPGSGHPLPPFHYNQAGVGLGCKVGCCSRGSLFYPSCPTTQVCGMGVLSPPKVSHPQELWQSRALFSFHPTEPKSCSFHREGIFTLTISNS